MMTLRALVLYRPMVLMRSASPASPKASKPSGVPCSGKNLRVARFTERSVAWADRMTAISSWNVLAYSSSVVGLGLAACSRLNISVRFAAFISISAGGARVREPAPGQWFVGVWAGRCLPAQLAALCWPAFGQLGPTTPCAGCPAAADAGDDESARHRRVHVHRRVGRGS